MALATETGVMQTLTAADSAGAGIPVPDASLLFTADFSRSGTDLILTGSEGAKFVVSGYFESDTPPSLLSPQGAVLTGDVVTSLAGPQFPGQYAQAGDAPSGKEAIGKVQTLDGSATVVRTNGITETLKVGDPVFQGDVVLTGPGSKLGVGFLDGTLFSMSSDARMVLNSFIYDPAGSDNSMLFSLVEGTFVFAAGQIAPTGDMKINTPVATMGIRGTSGIVEIEAALGPTNFKLIPDPRDAHEGSYILYNLDTGLPMGTVDGTGSVWRLTSADGTVAIFDKTDDELLKDADAISQINSVFNSWTNSPDVPQAGPENNSPNSSGGLNTNPPNNGNIIGPGDPNNNPGNGDPNQNNQGDPNPQSGLPPVPPNFDDLPPLEEIPQDTGVTVINGTPGDDLELNGTPGDDFIFGFGGNDIITAFAGDDVVDAGDGDDIIIAGEGEGDDDYDGGEGNDTIIYTSTSLGIVINLVDGTVNGAEIGFDTIVRLQNFVAGSGDDTFIFAEDSAIYFDGGAGTDTIQFFGNLNIDTATTLIEADNIEILDLNKTDENILTITASDIHDANDVHTLQIRGGSDGAGGPNDTVNLTPDFYNEVAGVFIFGSWVLAGTEQIYGIMFNVYEFFGEQGDLLATAQIEQGIDVTVGQTITGNDGDLQGPANVGYYDATDGQGDSDQVASIQAAGHNAVNITTPNAASLQGLNVLFLQVESNDGYGAEFLNNLAAIHNAVAAGMTLIIHDRFVDGAEAILPGSSGFNIVRNFDDSTNIDVLDPNSPVVNGPGGTINDATLDGGNLSSHGFAVEGTLPENAELILSTGDASNIVTFSYAFGAGQVIYSSIPLDHYLDGNGPSQQVTSNFSDIYATNVVAYGAENSLDADDNINGGPGADIIFGFGGDDTILGNEGNDTIIGGPGNDTIIGGPGNNTLTGGPGADKFVITGLFDGLDTITDFGSQDMLDLTGLLDAYFDLGDPANNNIDNFVQATTDGAGNITIAVDADGPTLNGSSYTPVAVLQNLGVGIGVNIAVMIGDDNATVESAALAV